MPLAHLPRKIDCPTVLHRQDITAWSPKRLRVAVIQLERKRIRRMAKTTTKKLPLTGPYPKSTAKNTSRRMLKDCTIYRQKILNRSNVLCQPPRFGHQSTRDPVPRTALG